MFNQLSAYLFCICSHAFDGLRRKRGSLKSVTRWSVVKWRPTTSYRESMQTIQVTRVWRRRSNTVHTRWVDPHCSQQNQISLHPHKRRKRHLPKDWSCLWRRRLKRRSWLRDGWRYENPDLFGDKRQKWLFGFLGGSICPTVPRYKWWTLWPRWEVWRWWPIHVLTH